MNVSPGFSPRRILHPLRGILLSFLLLLCVPVIAQAQPGSDDCSQGYADPPDVDPRNYWARCFPQVGTMSGNGVNCRYGSEDFGRAIAPVGDVNNDRIQDWVVSHARCDTIFPPRVPIELLLYRGVKGRLPDAPSGERIGPSEINSSTEFLASGDWDGDGHPDIAAMIYIYGDTTGGNTQGYHTARLAIFWGNAPGHYSLADTTRLSNGTEDLWINIFRAVSADFDGDGVQDLLAWGGGGIIGGVPYTTPTLYLYRGHVGTRWGRGGASANADWVKWTTPPTTHIGAMDQDGDGAVDLLLYHNTSAGTGHVSVLYGSKRRLPDTNDVRTTDLLIANGHYGLFSDITGDGIPELLLSCGNEQQVKVFIGLRGQRLLEQYGTGNDPAHPGSDVWWGRPWANIWLPNRINGNWTRANHELFDAGDANLDGLRDVWAVSDPFALCYTTGDYLDSLADALSYLPSSNGVRDMVNLGDIDGSGRATIAMSYYATTVLYIRPDSSIVSNGEVFRQQVPGTGPPVVSVRAGETVSAGEPLSLTAAPNPSGGDVTLTWNPAGREGETALVTIADLAGREVARFFAPAARGTALWPTAGLPRGRYLIALRIGSRAASTAVTLE